MPQPHPQARTRSRRHSAVVGALLLGVAVAGLRSGFAQSDRGVEIVDRAMAAVPNAANGRVLYKELCTACHGETAQGNAGTITPALAGQVQSYVVKQLADFAEGQRNEPTMQRVVAHKRITSPQALRDLASHVAGLPRNSKPEQGGGTKLDSGRHIYEKFCTECHGLRASGDELDVIPVLQGQHYSYLLKQIRTFSAGHREGVDVDVLHDMQALSLDELTGVADYISRLPVDAPLPVMAPR